jgi:iron complex transport system ATP-binding protein
MTDLRAKEISLAYPAGPTVIDGLTVTIPAGQVTAIIGANGSGKSTLLRGLARLITPSAGQVLLDGRAIGQLPTKEVARSVGLLPQGPVAPDGLTVEDLVARGRYPHQSLRRQWSQADERAVDQALAATSLIELWGRPVAELSGGQRQRAWIALVLAQDTPIMLLDEPTTFLDPAHQLEVLGLLIELNERDGRTIVAVLHDINQAGRFAHHLIAMRQGQILAEGTPAEVITEQVIAETFGITCVIIPDPVTSTPLCIPSALRRE